MRQRSGMVAELRIPPPAEEPIFLDVSGRRRRLVIVVGLAFAAVVLGGIGMLAFGLGAGAPVTVPGWPGAGLGRPEPASGEVGPALVGVASPTPTTVRQPSTSRTAAPVRTGRPSVSPTPTPSATAGRGAGHGNRPTAKPAKSPGKPG